MSSILTIAGEAADICAVQRPTDLFSTVSQNDILFASVAKQALANKGLKGLGLMTADAGLQGAAYGATSSDRLSDLPVNVAAGGAVGAATGGALGGAGRAIKRLFPSLNVIGKKSGLKNALDDIETLRAINRGSRASDEVAQGVLNRAQGVKGSLNDEMSNALATARGRELDIQNAIDTQQERLGKYVAKNADKELLDFSPTTSDLKSMKPRSSFNPNRKITEEEAISKLRKRFSDVGLEVYNDELSNIGNPKLGINHFVREGKDPFVRTVSQTFKNPDLKFTNDGKGYYIRKYINNDSGNTFEDLFLTKDGKAFNKLPSDEKHIAQKIKGAQDLSLAPMSNAKTPTSGSLDNYNIPLQRAVVNRNLPKLSDYTQGLTDFQAQSLNKALAEGASKSTAPLGTLGATHRGQEVLNDMIEASFDKSIIGTKRPTTDTRQLMALKERFNQILEPSGVKPYDESYSKAQALRTNFEKGYNFKPSETKFESLGLEKARDKRAFLQGRLAKILDDVTDEKSIATLVKKDQNTLKKLMTPKKFETLMKTADEIEGNYRNLKNLETTANSALRRSSDASRPLSELGESKGSIVGSALDKLFGGIYRRSDAATARRILSGQPIPQNSILLNNLRNSTPAVSGIMVEELLKN